MHEWGCSCLGREIDGFNIQPCKRFLFASEDTYINGQVVGIELKHSCQAKLQVSGCNNGIVLLLKIIELMI